MSQYRRCGSTLAWVLARNYVTTSDWYTSALTFRRYHCSLCHIWRQLMLNGLSLNIYKMLFVNYSATGNKFRMLGNLKIPPSWLSLCYNLARIFQSWQEEQLAFRSLYWLNVKWIEPSVITCYDLVQKVRSLLALIINSLDILIHPFCCWG